MTSPNENSKTPAGPELATTQDEFDVQFFGRILARNGDNADVLKRQAELLSRRGDYLAALELDMRLAAKFPADEIVQYNLACSLSLSDQRSQAVAALRRALQLGYTDFARLETDSDLDAIRDEPAFHDLLREYELLDD